MVHANVDHISGITKSSPYLSISLFLLTYNIIFTLVGVIENGGKQLILYIVSLVLFLPLCVVLLFSKCLFILLCTKIPRHQCRKLAETLLFDSVFVVMGTLYLAGDNLPILICRGMNSTTARDICIEQSSIIVGFSLLLHTALYVAGALKLKPTEVTAFPVTGRIRKAYQRIFQLVAFTIILDQTFSTVVRLITQVDIEIDESPNCGSTEVEVEGFLASLYIIMLPMILGLLVVKNWKDYCSCCWIKRKSMIRQCCCHFWENFLIFMVYIFVIGFMIIYTLADNRWLWKCTSAAKGDPTTGRIRMLVISLVLSLLWIAMYLVIICLPGVCIVCNKNSKKKFFTENDYALVVTKRHKLKWVCTDAKVKRKINGNDSEIDLTDSTDNHKAIEESYGSVSITLPIEENITCWQGLRYCQQKCVKSDCCSTSCTQCGSEEDTTCGNCLEECGSEEDTTCGNCLEECCASCLMVVKMAVVVPFLNCLANHCPSSCTSRWRKCWEKCKRCWEMLSKKLWVEETAEDGEIIMCIYLGKKDNIKNATFAPDGILKMNDGQEEEHAD